MPSTVDLRQLAIDRGDTGHSKVRRRRHLLTRYVLPCVLILGFLSLVAWASRDIVFSRQAVTVMPVISTTATAQREGTPLFQAAGWIEPRPTPVRVAALAPGVVEKLLVVQDQSVKAGEPVAQLVKDDAQLATERAAADLELRTAELAAAKSQLKAAVTRFEQPVHLQAALQEAEASLAKIETQLKSLPFELRRAMADQEAAQKDYAGKQAAQGVVAGVEIDMAKSKADSVQALVQELGDREDSLKQERDALAGRRDALQMQLKLLADETKAVESATAQVKVAEARVEQARVALAESTLRLNRMTIPAPIDGKIFRLVAHPGARIGGGSNQMTEHDGSTVVTMYRPEMLQVRVDVRFEDIPQLSLDQPVQINNPALSSPLTGELLFLSSEADIQKNTLEVKVAISDVPRVLKPEMLVDVTFLAPQLLEGATEPTQEVRLYVPRQLVQQDESGSFVWLADQSQRVARKTSVQTEVVGSGDLIEIKSGLTMTSRLIVSGSDDLHDGQRIKITGQDVSWGLDGASRQAGGGSSSFESLLNGEDN